MLMVEVRGEWFDKIKTLAGHNKYYLCGYQLSLLSQAFDSGSVCTYAILYSQKDRKLILIE